MVTTEINKEHTRVTLAPNRSLEWKKVKIYLLIFSLPAVIVAIGWWMIGVWIILPFAGLELGLLTFFMYRVCYQNYHWQQITVNKDYVAVSSGVHSPKQCIKLARPECYLSVSPPLKPMDSVILALTTDEQSVSVGDFLNHDDRELARRSLVAAGLIECSSLWFKKV